MLSKRCVSTAHHGVLIYTPPKHTLSCVILRTKGVFGEHTMVCSGNTLVFTVQGGHHLSCGAGDSLRSTLRQNSQRYIL